jgi:subtilisin-like proprotein convertase family protein
MRIKLNHLLPALSLSLATIARAQSTFSTYVDQPVNQIVPDQNINGVYSTISISGLEGSVQSIQVGITLTNGWTGDYYAYLEGPTGVFSVLFNRAGVTAGNPFGYSDTGFNVVLSSDAANNVHFYQAGSYSLDANGVVNGTFAPDGRNIDPLSAPAAFDQASTAFNLSPDIGTNPNGDWTFFIADLSGGYQGTLVDWSLTINTVPEPSTFVLICLGGLGMLCQFCHRRSV